MGRKNTARCTNCNFTRVFTFGGTRSSYLEHSLWIAYCEPCDNIEQINSIIKPNICLKCNSQNVKKYSESEMVKGGSEVIIADFDDKLTDGDYYCAKCRQFALKFSSMPDMLFD